MHKTHSIITTKRTDGTYSYESINVNLEYPHIDKKNYSIISRLIREAIGAGVIAEYDTSRMYVPYWAS